MPLSDIDQKHEMNTEALSVTSIVALIGALVALYVAWRKTPAEVKNVDADTAGKYQEIADKAAIRALALEERVTDLEATMLKQAGQIAILQAENALLRNWADRLVHQVRMRGDVPVEMDPSKSGVK
jgi:hypothetical protein